MNKTIKYYAPDKTTLTAVTEALNKVTPGSTPVFTVNPESLSLYFDAKHLSEIARKVIGNHGLVVAP